MKMNLNLDLTMKKISNYFSIFTIIFGTSIGAFVSTSNAADITEDTTVSLDADNDVAYDFTTTAGSTLTINNSADLDSAALAITDTVAGNVVVSSAGDADPAAANSTSTITSIVLDAEAGSAATNSNLTITDADDRAGTFIVNISGGGTAGLGDVDIAGDLIIQSLEDTDDEDMTVNVTGSMTIDETAVISTAGAGDTTVNLGSGGATENVTFTGGLTLTQGGAGLAILDVNGNGTVTGTIDGNSAGKGKLILDGDNTVASAIGSTNSLGNIDVDGATTFSGAVSTVLLSIDGATTFSSTLTATGATTIDAATTMAGDVTISATVEPTLSNVLTFTGTTFTASGTNGLETDADAAKLVVDGTAAQTIAAQITPDADDEATLENSNTAATVTFNEKIGTVGGNLMELVDTDTSTTSVFKKEVGAVLFTVDGTATLTLDANQATNVDINTDGTLIIDDTITNGQEIFLAGTSVVDGSVAGTGNIQMPANLLDGETLVLIAETTDAAEAAIVVDVEAAVLDTALRTYTVSNVDNGANDNDITITAADNSAVDVASNLGTTKNMGTALIQAGIAVEGDATALDAFSNALNANGFTATEDTALAKQVAPQTDMISGSSVAAQAVTGSVQGIMSSRMASLRSGDAYFGTGVAAGGMSAQSGFIQVFGSIAEQNNKTVGSGTQFGYDSNTEGLAIGFDGVTDDGMTLGVSLATANTDVDGKGTGKSTNSIDTYSASLYMDRATDNGYVEGSLTYGINENVTSRKVNSAGLDRTYTGSYDSHSLSLNISAGVPNEVGAGYLTPFGSFTASYMNIDAYTETSTVANDSLRLKVAQDDVNSMIGTLGVKFHTEMGNGGTPMISLAINNEFGDATIDSVNTYQGGGTAFKTTTAVEELSASLGLGYSYGSDAASIEFAYEADVNDDEYLSHYGSIKVVGKF